MHKKCLLVSFLIYFLTPAFAASEPYQDLITGISASSKSLNIKSAQAIKRDWRVQKGQNLHSILSEWASMDGWEVIWDSQYNYSVNASAIFMHMDIESAIKQLLNSMGAMQPQIFISMYSGNKVILVKSSAGV